MVTARGVIRPAETRQIEASAATEDEAIAALKAQIPDGYDLIALRVEK